MRKKWLQEERCRGKIFVGDEILSKAISLSRSLLSIDKTRRRQLGKSEYYQSQLDCE